jgi:tRNA-2-methylthio-N6-dimethylallyladenosine synthase
MEPLSQSRRYVFLETFGCQMNVDDSSRILGQLAGLNYRVTNDPEKADLILVNTCSIREKAEHRVYSALGRFKCIKVKRPDIIIGVGGCVAQQQGERLLKRLDYLDIVFGTTNINKLPELIRNVEVERRQVSATSLNNTLDPTEFTSIQRDSSLVKAYVTIMRGCNNFCSYCIVPYVRGREVSRKSADIITEVENLAAAGLKEITLIGQNVNSYGNDGNDIGFTSLIKEICKVDGIERIRFITSHPKDLSEELLYIFYEEKKVCRHIHLPIQSGSNYILKEMKRGYSREQYLSKIELLRKLYPDISITTDFIVGFPGESENDYLDTINLIKSVEFDNIFSFKYSSRPKTEAATLDGHLSDIIKSDRLLNLQEIQKNITLRKNRSMIGKLKEVLIEGKAKVDDGNFTGRTSCNRIVNFQGKKEWIGSIKNLYIEDAYVNSLKGKVKEE